MYHTRSSVITSFFAPSHSVSFFIAPRLLAAPRHSTRLVRVWRNARPKEGLKTAHHRRRRRGHRERSARAVDNPSAVEPLLASWTQCRIAWDVDDAAECLGDAVSVARRDWRDGNWRTTGRAVRLVYRACSRRRAPRIKFLRRNNAHANARPRCVMMVITDGKKTHGAFLFPLTYLRLRAVSCVFYCIGT